MRFHSFSGSQAVVVACPCCTQALQHRLGDRLLVPVQGASPPRPAYPSSKQVMNTLLPLVLIGGLCLCREVPSDQVPINLLDSALRDWAAGQRGQQGEQEDWQHQLRMLVQSGVPMVGHVMHVQVPAMEELMLAGAACPSRAQGQGRVAGLAGTMWGTLGHRAVGSLVCRPCCCCGLMVSLCHSSLRQGLPEPSGHQQRQARI